MFCSLPLIVLLSFLLLLFLPKLVLEIPAANETFSVEQLPQRVFFLFLPAVSAVAAADRNVLGKQKEKMPAILVASKMKSGLPKPVHSAAPILHVPTARAIPQPCYLKFGNKVEVTKPLYSSQIPLKSPNGQENTGDGLPPRKSSSVENGFDTQVRRRQVLGRCTEDLSCSECVREVTGGSCSEEGGGACSKTSHHCRQMLCSARRHV